MEIYRVTETRNRVIALVVVLLLLSGILFSFSYEEEASNKNDLYGVWAGEYQGRELLFTFNDDGTCSLSFKDIASGEMNEYIGTFEVVSSKMPMPLSIRNIPQLNHALHTIIEFEDNESLIMANFAPQWKLRPIFIDYDTNMYLGRVGGD